MLTHSFPKFSTLSTTFVTTVLVFYGASASALTLTGSSATWSNPVGGAYIQYDNVEEESQVRWGLAATFNGQSGLGFTGIRESELDFNQTFQLGTLRHFNNPIFGGTDASAVDLSLHLDLADLGVKTFNFTLGIDETTNSGTCAYFSVVPCADKISWTSIFASETFFNDGIEYTLQLDGFRYTPEGELVGNFISQEGGTSEAYLFGQITAVNPVPESVPEPTVWAGLSLLGLYFAANHRKQKA